MKRQALIGLKLLASVPLAVIIGALAGRFLENGLWPLLFFSDYWLHIIDMITQALCQIAVFCGLIWYWVLGR